MTPYHTQSGLERIILITHSVQEGHWVFFFIDFFSTLNYGKNDSYPASIIFMQDSGI